MSTERKGPSEQEQYRTWSATGLPTLVSQVPQRPGITHLLLFTSLFVPLVFLPYIPLRRHMWQQTRQLDAFKGQLSNQLSVTRENSKKLASAIHESQQLTREIQGLRAELQKINSGLERLQDENKEKEIRDLTQTQWNQEILGAIERMQRDTRP
jgi:septal ring factor EnvC (AmiA/AmiB activator)